MTQRPSPERLREKFMYDVRTGALTHRGGTKIGKPAMSTLDAGRLVGRVDDQTLRAHTVIWAMNFGYWPADHGLVIDHKNGDATDNRLSNLRAVPQITNRRNRHAPSAGKSGLVGVYPVGGKWQARIRVGGKHIVLGCYDTIKEASIARSAADRALGFTTPTTGRPSAPFPQAVPAVQG